MNCWRRWMVQVRPEEERPGGGCSVRLRAAREARLSLVHVKTIRREMVTAEAASGVYPKLSMSVALHKINPPICPFLIDSEIK